MRLVIVSYVAVAVRAIRYIVLRERDMIEESRLRDMVVLAGGADPYDIIP